MRVDCENPLSALPSFQRIECHDVLCSQFKTRRSRPEPSRLNLFREADAAHPKGRGGPAVQLLRGSSDCSFSGGTLSAKINRCLALLLLRLIRSFSRLDSVVDEE